MASSNTLTYTINVKDNFNTTLDKLASSVSKLDTNFNKLSSSLDKNVDKITMNLDRITQKMNLLGMNTTNTISHINNMMGSQFERLGRQQEQSINMIEQRYRRMVTNVNNDLQRLGNNNNSTNPLGENGSGGNRSPNQRGGSNTPFGNFNLESILRNVFSGNFTAILGKLGVLGTALTGVVSAIKLIDTSMNTGFDMLNTVTGNMFSLDGIKEALEDGMSFESGKASLEVFFPNDYQNVYEMATKVANETFASEKDTISIATRLGQVGVNMTDKQMKSLLGVGATQPTTSLDHIGLAVQEAIDGRIAMLKRYGINNYKLQDYYKYLQKNDKTQAKQLKGALNKKGTAGDAQKYFDLVVSYIDSPFSHMAGYADKYTQTLKGKMDRIQGLFDKAKAEIIGYNTESGEVVKGGFMDKFGEAVDNLKSKLEQPETIEFMQKISSALGTLMGGLSEAFIKLIDGVDLDKLAESISKVADVLADALNQLIDSGVLDELIEKLPIIVEQVLRFKGMELETDVKVKMDMLEGKWGQAGYDYLQGNAKKYGFATEGTDVSDVSNVGDISAVFDNGSNIDYSNVSDISQDLKNNSPVYNFFKRLFGNGSSDDSTVSDSQLMSMVDNGTFSNIAETDRESIKDYIKSDDSSSYNIANINVYANNVDELLESIKNARPNRK